jgi:hypothetical protein
VEQTPGGQGVQQGQEGDPLHPRHPQQQQQLGLEGPHPHPQGPWPLPQQLLLLLLLLLRWICRCCQAWLLPWDCQGQGPAARPSLALHPPLLHSYLAHPAVDRCSSRVGWGCQGRVPVAFLGRLHPLVLMG